MTDRELLEMASKAVGFIDDQTSDDEDSLGLHRNGQGIFYFVGKRGWHNWNPLTDDGDALRLAGKLGLWIHIGTYYVAIDGTHIEEACGQDLCAAARRAIVRAAAEIGKAM